MADAADEPGKSDKHRHRSARRAASDRLIRAAPGVGPALLMLAISAYGATNAGLGWDETATVDVARRSALQIWHTMHTVDAVVAPYYFLMHSWIKLFGTSELAFRAPSIIAMAIGVGLTGELGRRLFTPLIGLAAGLFLCVMPYTSRYAQEARPYATSWMLAALATLLLYRALDHPGARRWVGYGLTIVLLGASHTVALTLIGGHAVAVAVHKCRAGGWRTGAEWLVTVTAALAALLPLALLGVNQRDSQLYWVEPVTARTLGSAPGAIVGSTATAWLLVGLALLATWRPGYHVMELAALTLVPPAAVTIVSVLTEPVWVPRYLLIVLAPLALLAAVGVGSSIASADGPVGGASRIGLLRLLAVLTVLAVTAYPQQQSIRGSSAHNGANYRQAARLIQRYQQPGDGILYQSGRSMRAGIDYYLHEPSRPRDLLMARSAASVSGLVASEYPDQVAHVRGVNRVWLVVSEKPADPASRKPLLHELLTTEYADVGLWRLSRTTIALYQLRR
jgi:mannosyltransferase